MEKISTASRIHPLMAAAALSVITVSLAGTAAITGLLPSSQARTAAFTTDAVTPQMQLAQAQQLLNAQQLAAQPQMQAQLQPASLAPVQQPAVQQLAAYSEPAAAPVVKRKVQARPKVKTQRVVYREPAPRYDRAPDYRAPAPAPRPNYVGIGTGAVIGGLIGNQVGGGNGKKLATLAGIIGGGYIGNEVANRNQR